MDNSTQINYEQVINANDSVIIDLVMNINQQFNELSFKDAGVIVDYDEDGHKLQLMVLQGTKEQIDAIFQEASPYPEAKIAARMTLTPIFTEYQANRSVQSYAGDWENPPEYDEMNMGDTDISVSHSMDVESYDGNPIYHKALKNIAQIISDHEVFLLHKEVDNDDFNVGHHTDLNEDTKKLTLSINGYVATLNNAKSQPKDDNIALSA